MDISTWIERKKVRNSSSQMTNDRFPPKMFFARINSERGCSSLSVHSLVLWYARVTRVNRVGLKSCTMKIHQISTSKQEREREKGRKKKNIGGNSQREIKMFVRGRIRIDRWEPERVSRTYEAERLWIRALRWIIKFNIREERLLNYYPLPSVAEKIWPTIRKFQRIVHSSPILLNFRLEECRERRNLRLFNHLAQVLLVCLAQKVSKLGWRIHRVEGYGVGFKRLCWWDVSMIRVASFPRIRSAEIVERKGWFFRRIGIVWCAIFSNSSVNKSSKKRCNFFISLEKKCTFVYKWRRI